MSYLDLLVPTIGPNAHPKLAVASLSKFINSLYWATTLDVQLNFGITVFSTYGLRYYEDLLQLIVQNCLLAHEAQWWFCHQ